METGELVHYKSYATVFELVIFYEDEANKSILFVSKLLTLKSLHST